MKQALALTFLSSMTCLVAWDAEAAPHARPDARPHAAAKAGPHPHKADKKKIAKADPHPHKVDKKKKSPKAEPHPASNEKAKAGVPLSGKAKADASFSLGAKGAKGAKAEPPSAHHAEKAKKAEPHPADKAKGKGEPSLNEKESEELRAAKEQPRRSYWLAADPHVPLAVVEGTEIRSVGKHERDCGAQSRWARPKSRWHAVDAWGQVVGSLAVSGSDLDAATGCREVSFKGKEGSAPHILFVSEDSDWKPSANLAWTPKDDERKRFDHFTATLEKLWVNKRPPGKPLPLLKRAMFFQVPSQAAAASAKRPTRWAVVGGPILLVGYLGEHGRWKVASVQNPLGAANSYQPIGVFDMNGDRIPEIIYHSNEGPTHGDSVLSLDLDTLDWEDAAVSPGGVTL
jgi:hypothetical protein